jgi:biopolymer transport protein ExbB
MELETGLWLSWWHDADWVVRGVLLLLVGLSVLSWTIIFAKLWELGGVLRRERRLARHLAAGQSVAGRSGDALSARLLAGVRQGQDSGAAPARSLLREHLEQAVAESRVGMESRLTLLASIGSSAPFIGLLGTVWGIMHALATLDGSHGLSIERVAGPVGEALVATAAGLFTAIPAVVAYNLLVRRLRRIGALVQGNGLRLLDRALQGSRSGDA